MVFEGELAVKLLAKEVEVGTSSDRNPRQDLVPVVDLLTIIAFVI